MFSATLGPEVETWCRLNLDNMVKVRVGAANSATDTISQKLVYTGTEAGKLLEFRNMVRAGLQPPVLVFVQTKERATELFKELLYDGINVDVIHSERSEQQRENTVRAFRSGDIWVLICTELMGRGIDFKGVNLVINYDFPPSAVRCDVQCAVCSVTGDAAGLLHTQDRQDGPGGQGWEGRYVLH